MITGPQELSILRDRGVQLREGTLRSRGEALLPLLLTTYIFESLVSAQTGVNRRPGDEVVRCRVFIQFNRLTILEKELIWMKKVNRLMFVLKHFRDGYLKIELLPTKAGIG